MVSFWMNSSYFTLPFGSIPASLKRSSTAINHSSFSVGLQCHVIRHPVGGWASPEVFPAPPADCFRRWGSNPVNRKGQPSPSPWETMESVLSSSGFLQGPGRGVLVRIQSMKPPCIFFFLQKISGSCASTSRKCWHGFYLLPPTLWDILHNRHPCSSILGPLAQSMACLPKWHPPTPRGGLVTNGICHITSFWKCVGGGIVQEKINSTVSKLKAYKNCHCSLMVLRKRKKRTFTGSGFLG